MTILTPEPFKATRRIDWTVRWVEFIKDSLDLKSDLVLDWEHITCTSWCGSGIEEITGVNPFDPYEGKFSTVLGACKVIQQTGCKSLDELIAKIFVETPIGHAQTGDLVLVKASPEWLGDLDEGELFASDIMPHGLALVDPPFFWCVTPQGLAKGQLYRDGVRAFTVGRKA